MLLHDSYFHYTNKSINKTDYGILATAYSPLFNSAFTLIISVFGLFFNLICSIKIWFVISQYRQRKLRKLDQERQEESQESIHILSHNKYRFLFILTSNDFLLCLSSIISCLDEKYFFQSFLARHHLCAAHILIWKFALHFTPLLIIVILYRYHYILNKNFQIKSANLSTLNQLLCTDLSILIPFVLALAWSVDGLWLWGVANIRDYVMPSSSPHDENHYHNETTGTVISSSNKNISSVDSDGSLEHDEHTLYLPEQATICYLQTNPNFTVRLVHLIQADFLLLCSLYLIGLLLEILLHIRLCYGVVIRKITSTFNHERQLCMYILYIFIILTLTALPFYIYRTIEIIFDTQLTSMNNDIVNSRTFAQILLFGACFKPLLFFILFFPTSALFKLKFYLKCYSPTNIQIIDQDKQHLTSSNNQHLTSPNNKKHMKEQLRSPITRSPHHRYSLFMHSSYYPKFQSKLRTQSNPIITTTNNNRQNSLSKAEHLNSWLKLTNSIIVNNSNETSNTNFV